jgi:uncharacterized membrane protein
MTVGEKSSTGLDANVAGALSYLLGIITGVVFYAIEKDSRFVKFHAMQSILVSLGVIALSVAYGVVSSILVMIPVLGWLAALALFFVWIIATLGVLVLWILLMIKAFQGERYKLPWFGDLAEKQLG